jgi:hypothetical protein
MCLDFVSTALKPYDVVNSPRNIASFLDSVAVN